MKDYIVFEYKMSNFPLLGMTFGLAYLLIKIKRNYISV